MRYRKFSADHLFTGHSLLGSDAALITTGDGAVEAIVPLSEAGEAVETFQGILCPGFVNCHCHLELSHLKGLLPAKTGMIDFLLAVMQQRAFPVEEIGEAVAKAEDELYQNGIVAVGDICNTGHTLGAKKRGRLQYQNFIETMGFVEATAAQRFARAETLYQAFADAGFSEQTSIVPHAPYSVSGRLMQQIIHFPGNDLLTIHNQESDAENEFFQQGSGDFNRLYQTLGIDISFFKAPGTTSLQQYINEFLPQQSLILVHNVSTSEADLQFRAQSHSGPGRVYFCLCPGANLYINDRMPPVDLFRRYACPLVVGTDSLASNEALDILGELKILQKHFPGIPVAELLQWATLNGARALQMEGRLGSFERGKKPGILCLENSPATRLTEEARVVRIL